MEQYFKSIGKALAPITQTLAPLLDVKLSISLLELVMFVVINSLCILLRKYKLGLIISYCFVLYWGFVLNYEYLSGLMGKSAYGLNIYVGIGIAMLVLVIVGLFYEDRT